ncbi:MAG: CatB-related O-acetyltransferase [Candidatus Micrarchaeota archaeon]|nr:CatB-related O-acetyltransferase [Candidatus Micrarchaeota archaeon]MDE1804684.1 CatB-related O-acetyltransferase [Candidatus Micrarchaeota archaeon]
MLNSRHTPEFVSNHMNGLILNNEEAEALEEKLFLERKGRMDAHIEIGNDVWIGGNVTILGSRKIGDGAVIGTGSVVTEDVEPYSVVVGVPAKPIRARFDKETVDALKRIKWWEWDQEDILDNIELFYNPKKFVAKFSKKSK